MTYEAVPDAVTKPQKKTEEHRFPRVVAHDPIRRRSRLAGLAGLIAMTRLL